MDEPLKKYKGLPIRISPGDSGKSNPWKGNAEGLLRVIDKIVSEGATNINLWKGDAIMLAEHFIEAQPVNLTALSSANSLMVKELSELADA